MHTCSQTQETNFKKNIEGRLGWPEVAVTHATRGGEMRGIEHTVERWERKGAAGLLLREVELEHHEIWACGPTAVGSCYHQRPCGCPWSGLPPEVMLMFSNLLRWSCPSSATALGKAGPSPSLAQQCKQWCVYGGVVGRPGRDLDWQLSFYLGK